MFKPILLIFYITTDSRFPKMFNYSPVHIYRACRFIRLLNQSNCESWIVNGNIRKINIKSRLWDERHIIQGFQVFLSSGETHAFGMELDDTVSVETLEVPADQHIKDFIVRCGWYIDAIGKSNF